MKSYLQLESVLVSIKGLNKGKEMGRDEREIYRKIQTLVRF